MLFLALLDRPPLVAASEPDGKFTEPGRQALLGEPTNLQPQQKEPTELTKDGGEEWATKTRGEVIHGESTSNQPFEKYLEK